MRDRITPALDETQLPSPRPSWLSLCAKSNSAGSRCCLPCKGAVAVCSHRLRRGGLL